MVQSAYLHLIDPLLALGFQSKPVVLAVGGRD